MTLQEGVGIRIERRLRLRAEAPAGAPGALAGDNRLETRERVDSQLRQAAAETNYSA